MSENESNAPKVETIPITAIREDYDNTRVIFFTTTNPLNRKQKFEMIAPVPLASDGLEAMEEMLKERYDCNVDYVVQRGVRAMTTQPDYPGEITEFTMEGKKRVYTSLKENAHELAQAAFDNFKVGKRSTAGPTQKRKAAELDAANAELKKSGIDSVGELIAKAKAAGIILE